MNKYILIKELREKTGIGFLDCKNALIKNKFNLTKAINYLHTKGKINKIKSFYNLKEGIIISKYNKYLGIILEINCKTDFVSKNEKFIKLSNEIINYAFDNKIDNLDYINFYFKDKIQNLINKIDEPIIIRNYYFINKYIIHSFVHNKKMGTIISVKTKKKNIDNNILKNICMHIISKQPKYIEKNNIPIITIKKEFDIQYKLCIKLGKNFKIAKKIAYGKLKKYIKNICLNEQSYIFNEKIIMKKFLKKNNLKVKKFIFINLGN